MRLSLLAGMLCCVLAFSGGICSPAELWAATPIGVGEAFPAVALPTPRQVAQQSYLGLPDTPTFTLDQVAGRVVVVEILNVLCPHCQRQTQPYNDLFQKIETDPVTRGKIKMLGVAVANSDAAIADFVSIYSVAYPVVSDRNFKLYKALRAGPTPFTLYVLRDHPGDFGVIADTHLGEDYDMPQLFDYLKYLLTINSSEFTTRNQTETKQTKELRPPQSDAEIIALIQKSFTGQGQDLKDFHRLQLPSQRWVYSALLKRHGQLQRVFAEVANRSSICDVCHSVHFFYTFDQTGRILDFVPLHLTKYGNAEWSRAESDHFAKRVIGKNLAGNWTFDAQADAVSSATMTSAIIFDDLSQGPALLKELQQEHLLTP